MAVSNEHMEAPTPEQSESINTLMKQLDDTGSKTAAMSRAFGAIRSQLNEARRTLAALKEVIDPQAYAYDSRDRWQTLIDKRIEAIDALLK